ncbi:MAG: DUF87 domain-containing protein [Ignisphaera sp.]
MPLTLSPSQTTDYKNSNSDVYVGVDLVFGKRVSWNVEASPSQHILVVGPTGSGKSVAVSVLASRLSRKFGAPITVFDIKNEYEDYMKLLLNRSFNVWDVVHSPIPLCTCNDESNAIYYDVQLFVSTVNSIFKMPSYTREQLYDALVRLCKQCNEVTLEEAVPSYLLIDEYESLSTLFSIFKVYESPHNVLNMLLERDVIIDLHKIFLLDKKASAITILYIVKQILKKSRVFFESRVNRVVVLDELWHLTHHAIDEFMNVLVRYSRGFGISLAMATQNIDDLKPYTDSIIESCGMLLALSSASQSYWLKLAKYLNLSRKGIENAMRFSNRGTGVLRIYPHEKPLHVYIDPFDE